jgi:FkbM family methyltransferase
MKTIIKNLFNKIIITFVNFAFKFRVGRFVINKFILHIMEKTKKVIHKDITMEFATPNNISFWRAESFSIKEPETLDWIDGIQKDKILWDIGSNVGLYSIYAAKKGIDVLSFEPSVFNLELLARNIFLNNLTEKISIIPIPLSSSIKKSDMNLTTKTWGGALSTFGEKFDQDGNIFEPIFKFNTIGISIDEAINYLDLPVPNFIKMDVDGLEHIILAGGECVLKKIDGILIEVNENFKDQSNGVSMILKKSGLKMVNKKISEFEIPTTSKNVKLHTANQIWSRQ